MLRRVKQLICTYIGLFSFPVLCWTISHLVTLLTEVDRDPDSTTGTAHAHMHAHSTDFLLPPAECTTSETRDALAAWALYGFVPAVIMINIFYTLTFACIVVANVLGEDAIEDVTRNLDLEVVDLSDGEWKAKIHDPMIGLARSTLPIMDELAAPIGSLIVASLALGFGQIPLAVATENVFRATLVVLGFVTPLMIAAPIAEVGSSCDDMMDTLNELLVEGDDEQDKAYRRVMRLKLYLQDLNRRQGLGVRIFRIVLDKRKLAQIAAALFSVGSTLVIALYEIGRLVNSNANDSAMVSSTCSVNVAERHELWVAMSTILSEGVNSTCSYDQLALPSLGLGL